MKKTILPYLILFTSILFFTTSVFSQEGDLQNQFQKYYQNGEYGKALEIQQMMLKGQPDNPNMLYTMGCLYSLVNQKENALDWLNRSAEHGFANYIWAGQDADLENVRDMPQFSDILRHMKEHLGVPGPGKSITLREGFWTDILLQDSAFSYPKVEASLSYDTAALRIKAVVHDIHFLDGNRSFRYGDGFMLNFVFPREKNGVESDEYYTYGFSLENKTPAGVCVVQRKKGYSLRHYREIAPEISIDSTKHEAHYTIVLPWSFLFPFRPLLDKQAGINIQYTSQGKNGDRRILQWVNDPYFDTELTNIRRYAPLTFKPSGKSETEITGALKSRWLDGNEVELKAGIFSPEVQNSRITYALTDSAGNIILKKNDDVALNSGANYFSKKLTMPSLKEGRYKIVASLAGKKQWAEEFYGIDSSRYADLKRNISSFSAEGDQPLLANSIRTLRYKMDQLDNSINELGPRDDPFPLAAQLTELRKSVNDLEDGKNVFTRAGYMLAAFRSSIDSTLQPYSLYLPKNISFDKKYHLLVALHGSGVDEYGTAVNVGKNYADDNTIVVAPRGRGLSDFYTGKSEQDALDVINTAQKMFHIDKTILYGFSMGGYGCWRLSFLHPELFDGVIVASGVPYNPRRNIPGNDMRNYTGHSKKIPYLVFHGTADRSLDIAATDNFVQTLLDNGYRIDYHRIAGAGHGNYDITEIVRQWIKKLL